MINPQLKNYLRKSLIYLVLIMLVCLWLLPLVSTLLIAFKSPSDFLNSKFYHAPKQLFFFKNLQEVFRYYRLQNNFFNSILYAVVGVAICIFVSSMAAFSVTKLKPKFSFLIFLGIYSGTVFPFQMYLIPLFSMYNKLGIYNTKFGMFLFYATICTPFATFLYRGFFLSFPDEVMEAALIDGCGPVRLYYQIFVPQLVAPTAVVILFQAIWIWNDLLFGMVLSATEDVRPIMVAITQVAGTGGGNIPVMMSGVIFSSIPTILLFIGLRKYFIQGYILSSVQK